MKPAEFYEILERFVHEQARWKALKVGDTVYDEQIRGIMDSDYHEAVIKEINIDERFIIVDDLSVDPVIERRYVCFITQEEFEKL